MVGEGVSLCRPLVGEGLLPLVIASSGARAVVGELGAPAAASPGYLILPIHICLL